MNTSEMVSRFSGIPVPKNKAVVGGNAFSHESGIHQDGVLKILSLMRSSHLNWSVSRVIAFHLVMSGRHAFVEKLRELALDFTEEDIKPLFAKFKALADKNKKSRMQIFELW